MDAPTAAGLTLGVVADLVLADPRRGHPVAGLGRAAAALERRLWADRRSAGVVHTAVVTTAAAALGTGLSSATRGRPVARSLVTAAATWTVLGGTSLARTAGRMAAALADDDLPAARAVLPSLAGRDPRGLGEGELARATVESVAENACDAAVAPLFWGAVAGVPGLLAYRAVNTLDAMVGHRSPRYERFGWAAARLDDAANWAPARITAALTVVCAPLAGGSASGALRAWRRDGAAHPSPNAGRCEAALAGALGLRLGGRNVYGSRVEDRPPLGSDRPPGTADIPRAVRLSRVGWTAAAVLAVASRLVRARRCPGHPARRLPSREPAPLNPPGRPPWAAIGRR